MSLNIKQTMSNTWCTIESDPAIFSSLIRKMGVKGLEVEELYGLDSESIGAMEPKALIFLFKWDPSLYPPSDKKKMRGGQQQLGKDQPFYITQTVSNACATMALLNSILNIPTEEKGFSLGPELSSFKEFALELPVRLRGDLVRDSVVLRTSHNHFARPEHVIYRGGVDSAADPSAGNCGLGDDDPFHFISLTPFGGELWELDGLSTTSHPISHGSFCDNGPGGKTTSSWYELASKVLFEKIQKIQDGGSDIRFSLMGIRRDRLEELEEWKREGVKVVDDHLDIDNEIQNHLIRRAEEDEDNVRRCHNWVPLALGLIEQISNF